MRAAARPLHLATAMPVAFRPQSAVPTLPLLAAVLLVALGCPREAAAQRPVSPTRVTCESRSNARVECSVPLGSRVRLLQSLSRAACVQGTSWGVRGSSLWVARGCRGEFAVEAGPAAGSAQRLTCGSEPGGRRECTAPGDGAVTLLRQIGATPCVRGRTWGYAAGRVWVSDGCEAEFEVEAMGAGDAVEPFRVVCESEDGRRRECLAGHSVRLLRQLSRSECAEGRTWGLAGGRVWVDAGCRAEFEVRPR